MYPTAHRIRLRRVPKDSFKVADNGTSISPFLPGASFLPQQRCRSLRMQGLREAQEVFRDHAKNPSVWAVHSGYEKERDGKNKRQNQKQDRSPDRSSHQSQPARWRRWQSPSSGPMPQSVFGSTMRPACSPASSTHRSCLQLPERQRVPGRATAGACTADHFCLQFGQFALLIRPSLSLIAVRYRTRHADRGSPKAAPALWPHPRQATGRPESILYRSRWPLPPRSFYADRTGLWPSKS